MRRILIALFLILALGVLPALAQDGTSNSVQFNGVSFTFDSSLATNVNIWQYPGDAPDLQQPGGAEPPYTQFNLYTQQPAPEAAYDAPLSVRVYRIADIQAYPDSLAQVQALQNLIAQQPDLAAYMTVDSENSSSNALPYLPVAPASQVIRGQAHYIQTPTLNGVAYISVYRQDVSPFVNNEFRYTFQGLSRDGQFYVSAIFQVVVPDFPAEIPADFNYETFSADFVNYLNESVGKLNSAAPDTFAPSLTALDAFVQTITTFSGDGTTDTGTGTLPVVPTVPTNTDPTLGGLANTVWSLVSYGPADAPVAALPSIPVTATFSEQGVAGTAGCNSYSGPFQYSEGNISFGALISTKMACAEDVMAQETAYFNALATATTYVIANGQLQITYDGGVLTFAGIVPTS